MTYLIAEVGQAHDGSLGMLHAYIDAMAKTGVDAIKFQTHIAEAESSLHEPFRVKFSRQDKTRYAYWERMSFSQEQWNDIGAHCKEVGLDFISSPFSNEAVDVLEKAGVQQYKIGSGEVTNFLLLEKIAQTQKPVIVSSGMSSWDELKESLRFLKSRGVDYSVLQCTTKYPTQPQDWGLNMIQEFKAYFKVNTGYSDHSGSITSAISAMSLDADILEFHVVFHKEMFGPDVSSSLNLEEVRQIVKARNELNIALENPVDKSDHSQFESLKTIFEKSLAVNKDLEKGHILRFEDLEAKKPKNFGIEAGKFQSVIGKKLKITKKQWDFLKEEDLEA
ncbi:N-acetylneuraminate synthase family protein [Psychroflexus sp. CAK57W]|uniref:N-acetylneuraminate synthase family protein n=1 Tax=Psychroflexus curvus TaxID=2873595 RepID=UPI001CCA7691|nr:N-acetylneuraminate synthase family protein [Psychroflexus curvus]MBZ9787820.1 N-acetylneuraminate synthase family protein [Psychroflexus curvus]